MFLLNPIVPQSPNKTIIMGQMHDAHVPFLIMSISKETRRTVEMENTTQIKINLVFGFIFHVIIMVSKIIYNSPESTPKPHQSSLCSLTDSRPHPVPVLSRHSDFRQVW